jgi:hypothetical protein
MYCMTGLLPFKSGEFVSLLLIADGSGLPDSVIASGGTLLPAMCQLEIPRGIQQ